MVEDHTGFSPEYAQRRREIRELENTIQELLFYETDEDAKFVLSNPNWIPPGEFGEPPDMLQAWDEVSFRVSKAVQTELIDKLSLNQSDIVRPPEWDDDGSVSITESTVVKFIESLYESVDDVSPVREVLESDDSFVLDGRLVWGLTRDHETERWWVNALPVDGFKLRTFYAGYLQGRLHSLEALN